MAVRLKNTKEGWGFVTIALHWSMAAMVLGMFVLGLYMTGLEYLHPWYRAAPRLHKGVGLCVFALLLFRTFWSAVNVRPAPIPGPAWEGQGARLGHRLLYPPCLFTALSDQSKYTG